MDLGKSETWVQQALGHAFDSQITRKYMSVREDSMMDVFGTIVHWREKTRKLMTPQQIEKAQEMARNWQPKK